MGGGKKCASLRKEVFPNSRCLIVKRDLRRTVIGLKDEVERICFFGWWRWGMGGRRG